jgi:sulfide dehydrogenase [flavocytochrome c] flavoprotein subunit
LDAVPDGGTIVMIAPPNPYRCPPGPYERVSMMAHTLKVARKNKAKIVIIDPKPKFSKQGLFTEGWEKYYPGMVEWMAPDIHSGLKSVDPKSKTVVTGFETYKNAALVNVIPAQKAGMIAQQAKLVDKSGFCPIDGSTMRSLLDKNIFVIGDSSIAAPMPKSGFAANSQAKVAAMAVRGDLTGSKVFPARYANTCWSLIEDGDVVKVGAAYGGKDGKIVATSTFISKTKESADIRKQNVQENLGWYAGIAADIFG